MAELINSQSSAIERRLERSLSSTRILAQEVRQRGGLFDDFEPYADEVIQSIGGISNLQLAPDGIIHSIHPLAGNEKAIGHNILKDDKRRKEALTALMERNMTLAGPFELIQGGIAVVGRNPVFLKNTPTGEERFWGFASALIYLEDLIAATELDLLYEKGYAYELLRVHPDTGAIVSFASSPEPVSNHYVQMSIAVPNSEWFLRMSAPMSVLTDFFYLGYLLSTVFAFIVASLLRRVLLQPKLLQQVVDQQTTELKHLAHHDALTQLPNRIQLNGAVERALKEYSRYHVTAALLMIDLDDFKPINDLFGHDVGDSVLKVVAQRLRLSTREVDMVARIGGDEFSVLLQHTDSASDVVASIEHILSCLKQPIAVGSHSFTISASIGVAMLSQDGDDCMSLYKHADMAMYAAKDTGKNKFCFYDEQLQIQAVEKIQIQHELMKAVKDNELELYLQPIVTLQDGQVAGYEALVRWNHPERGFLPPNYFIGIAESSGAIFALGYWVIAEACRLIRAHQITVKVSVNLSPRQFRDPELVNELKKVISASDIEVSLLELELTESCFIDDIEGAVATMQALTEMGLSIALDDFGTGYSSLSLLQRLPVNKLKIDRSFVRDLTEDERDKNIVQGLNVIAHKLNLTVVAEGIETQEQLDILQEMSCDLGQGYFFAKPKPVGQVFEEEIDLAT